MYCSKAIFYDSRLYIHYSRLQFHFSIFYIHLVDYNLTLWTEYILKYTYMCQNQILHCQNDTSVLNTSNNNDQKLRNINDHLIHSFLTVDGLLSKQICHLLSQECCLSSSSCKMDSGPPTKSSFCVSQAYPPPALTLMFPQVSISCLQLYECWRSPPHTVIPGSFALVTTPLNSITNIQYPGVYHLLMAEGSLQQAMVTPSPFW